MCQQAVILKEKKAQILLGKYSKTKLNTSVYCGPCKVTPVASKTCR